MPVTIFPRYFLSVAKKKKKKMQAQWNLDFFNFSRETKNRRGVGEIEGKNAVFSRLTKGSDFCFELSGVSEN